LTALFCAATLSFLRETYELKSWDLIDGHIEEGEIPFVNFANIFREVVMDYINETDESGKV
jgi:hypothetical protein